MLPLPIDAFVGRIVEDVRRTRAVVVTAEPGAGKTTRIPPALIGDGPVIVLQPRRIAARTIAARIADERGWTIGREVGWQVRFERQFSAETRLLVVTEGILTARLVDDPLLSGFRTIVFDEFHERTIHGDLAMALAAEAWRARDDLRIVVMSATIDAGPISAFLGGCPVVDVPGALYPTEIEYAAGQPVADAALDVLGRSRGDLLCFLPGAGEIRRELETLSRRLPAGEVDLVPLHGSLPPADQAAAMAASARRRIVLATNIAETSITVPGVSAVIDSGLQKTARYDAERAIDSLETERIPADAARQRAGRASRLGPGVVRRLWDPRDRLRPHREPEIHRVDLSGPLLDVMAGGWDVRRFAWFEPPRDEAIARATLLLERLGLAHDGTITRLGDRVRRLPVHPRLARMLIADGGSLAMARAITLLSERHLLPPRRSSTDSDLLSALDEWTTMPGHLERLARQLQSIAGRLSSADDEEAAGLAPTSSSGGDARFLRAVLAGYPDRVAQRREPGSPRVRLSSGTGAVLGSESGVHAAEFLVALDVHAYEPSGRAPDAVRREPFEPRIRMASRIERDWLRPDTVERVHRFDRESGRVKATLVERYGALVLSERPTEADPAEVSRLLADAWLRQGPGETDAQLLRRLRFAGHDVDLASIVRTAADGAGTLAALRLVDGLSADVRRTLERDAPETLRVPSGRVVRLEYAEDGTVSASVKLQELFGLNETPMVGRQREPVLLALLAPNGRPVQLTRDLRSFWERTYPEVRKELRGRYPKHPWPTDPSSAPPTARVTPKARSR